MTYAVTPLRLEEHRDALARLWAENMSDARIAEAIPQRMRWLYEQGPDGPATTVLALEAESGSVIGCGSFLPRPTWVDGRRLRAGVLCDFAVTRAHRVAGAALAIQRALVEAGGAAGLGLLYGYPNEKSIAVFRRIGYRVVGETTTWVKPLRSGYKLREVLRWRWAAWTGALLLDAALGMADRLRSLRAARVTGELLPAADGRVDALWERTRARQVISGEKTAAYLDWRYGRFTTAEHRIFGVTPRGAKRLAGLAVYALREGKAFLRELSAEDEEATDALLLALAVHLRRARVDSLSLSYLGSPAFGERLRRLGFLQRPGKRALVLHPEAVPEPLRARVFDPASWFMLEGELDI